MDKTEDLNKIVPDSEDSDPGYVQLVNEGLNRTEVVITNPSGSASPIPPSNGAKIKISLSQEQIKIKPVVGASSSSGENERVQSTKNTSKISLSSPPIKSSIKTNKSIAFKDVKKAKDLSTRIICKLCSNPFVDPRVLSCLHCFCLSCLNRLVDSENVDVPVAERSSTTGTFSSGDAPQQSIRRTSQKSLSSETTTRSKSRSFLVPATRNPVCPVCEATTTLPIGGLSRLPKNTIISRLVDKYAFLNVGFYSTCVTCGDIETPSSSSLAKMRCNDCSANFCQPCADLHVKQTKSNHHKLSKIEPRKSPLDSKKSTMMKCPFHPNSDLKLFCTNCHQVACTECMVILHSGHKCESIHKTIKVYSKLLNDSISRVRPLNDYATLTISKLIAINKKIDKKCESVRNEVEAHMYDYQRALDHHRNTLFHQVQKAREMKVASIESQKCDLEKRSSEAKTAIEFAELVLENGSDVEVMSFIGAIIKRFDYCEKSKVPLDANVNDSLRFLPEIRAPSSSAQNHIPLFGIITTQTADPGLCSLEGKGLGHLKVNKRVELTLIARDRDNKQLCHGGLTLQVELKYVDFAGRIVEHQVTDNRDGSYVIAFTPSSAGTIRLSICISGKAIKDSPFVLMAKNLKPHSGIYHCCTFCSSNGSKTTTCACSGTMEGYNGCGHGHSGHPGRRHWSCCGNILENSECLTVNEFGY